jgi:transposase-like protein
MTTEKEKQLINYYIMQKLSADKIANLMCINRKTVYATLKKNNIKARTIAQAAMKYSCNENFFELIDTEEKAYWLGALYADGNVSQNKTGSGKIFLSSKDYKWIERFMRSIESTNKPTREFHKKYQKEIWKAQITSTKMFNDLVRLGCIPRKSMIITFPELPSNLISHFIRGYFDGDGTVGIYQNLKKHNWKILKSGICSGSELFLRELVTYLPTKNKNVVFNKSLYVIQLSLKDSILLHDYMYKNANVFLIRKAVIFTTYLSKYYSRERFNDYNNLP